MRERLSTVCVFCGSSPGARAAYRDAAEALGRVLAAQGRTLAYGGGNVGLMGVIADAFVLLPGGLGSLEEFFEVDPERLLARLDAHEPASMPKWIDRRAT